MPVIRQTLKGKKINQAILRRTFQHAFFSPFFPAKNSKHALKGKIYVAVVKDK